MVKSEPAGGVLGGLWAVLRQRCPRCRRGRMFKGRFAMNDPCPECGLLFQREEGYFLGAMYVSYTIAAALLVPLYFAAQALFPDVHGIPLTLGVMLVYWPLVPWVFRMSRVVWVNLDRLVAAGESGAGAYEKVRLRELEEKAGDGLK